MKKSMILSMNKFASNKYIGLLEHEHNTTKWGLAAEANIQYIRYLIETVKATDILDYGCGQGVLKRLLGDRYNVIEYDIGIPELRDNNIPAEFVVCVDVLEHVEPEYINVVLEDLHRVTLQSLFLTVSTIPAKRILKDGTNAHLIIEDVSWWLQKIEKWFIIGEMHPGSDGFSAFCYPKRT